MSTNQRRGNKGSSQEGEQPFFAGLLILLRVAKVEKNRRNNDNTSGSKLNLFAITHQLILT